MRLEYEDIEDLLEDIRPDNECCTCRGTGIGQFGDPDTAKCHSCGGRGWHLHDADDPEGRW